MGHKVFVYGTLKKSGNNSPLLDGQKFLGKAVTKAADFKLHEIKGGNYNYPALTRVDSSTKTISGEVPQGYQVYGEAYEVGDKCLAYLDYIEGVAVGLYSRQEIDVILDNGESIVAIAYFFEKSVEKCSHVGQCWPIQELKRYRLADKNISCLKEEVTVNQVGLWDIRQDKLATKAFDSEEELNQWLRKNPKLVGAIANKLWNPSWFEIRFLETTKTISQYQFADFAGKPIGPKGDLHTLAGYAAKELTMFGGENAMPLQWHDLLTSIFQNELNLILDDSDYED